MPRSPPCRRHSATSGLATKRACTAAMSDTAAATRPRSVAPGSSEQSPRSSYTCQVYSPPRAAATPSRFGPQSASSARGSHCFTSSSTLRAMSGSRRLAMRVRKGLEAAERRRKTLPCREGSRSHWMRETASLFPPSRSESNALNSGTPGTSPSASRLSAPRVTAIVFSPATLLMLSTPLLAATRPAAPCSSANRTWA